MKHLIFIVAYNHENFITKVLERLPQSLQKEDYEILIIDDASIDKTFELANKWSNKNNTVNIKILKNIKNYGYGGNQKLGMKYAIENNFDTIQNIIFEKIIKDYKFLEIYTIFLINILKYVKVKK